MKGITFSMTWIDGRNEKHERKLSSHSYRKAEEDAEAIAEREDLSSYTLNKVVTSKVVRKGVTVEDIEEHLNREIEELKWGSDGIDRLRELRNWIAMRK